MARTPCCERMGMKKGPWTPEEDQILISYIHRFGHGNWRALPKQAGLMRCGKSCRLRWINYLRPDLKRGNFSKEEEETILNLHGVLGNRWSAIAARLPGRTDNEIKNFWHTHLKKRMREHSSSTSSNRVSYNQSPYCYMNELPKSFFITSNNTNIHQLHSPQNVAVPPDQQSRESPSGSSKISSLMHQFSKPKFHLNRTEVGENTYEASSRDCENHFPKSSFVTSGKFPCYSTCSKVEEVNQISLVDKDGLDFWYSLFIKAGENS